MMLGGTFKRSACRSGLSGRLLTATLPLPGNRMIASGGDPSKVRATRRTLLEKIYEPFAKLHKDSTEWAALARSGKVWEDYFSPQDSQRMGYKALQKEYKHILAEIDEFKTLLKPQIPQLARTLVAEYAHQSVSIENNPLKFGDSIDIFDFVSKELFAHVDIASLAAAELSQLSLPQFLPKNDPSAVNELKNHIGGSQWISENAVARPSTPGMSQDEAQHLSAMTVKDTEAEEIYSKSWGGRVALGGYRKLPIGVRGNLLRIFPYPEEVPACVDRFFQWRDAQHQAGELHPLILACQMTAYFVHIHPFPDGNGRVSRMLMHDYMVRQGYLPVVIQDLQREDYLRMISNACDGKPQEFVITVLSTQLDELHTFFSQHSTGRQATEP